MTSVWLITYVQNMAVFATSTFNFGLSTYFFHIIVAERHFILCSVEGFLFKNSRAELFDCGVVCHVKGHTYMYVGEHDSKTFTPCFCFASLVCFGSLWSILSGFSRDWCCFTSRILQYTLLECFVS